MGLPSFSLWAIRYGPYRPVGSLDSEPLSALSDRTAQRGAGPAPNTSPSGCLALQLALLTQIDEDDGEYERDRDGEVVGGGLAGQQ